MIGFIAEFCKKLEKISIYPRKFLFDPPFLWVTFNTPFMKELDTNFINFYRNANSKIDDLKYRKLLEKEKMHLFNLIVMINAFNASLPDDHLHQLVFSYRRLHTKIISNMPTMIEVFEKFSEFIKNANSNIGQI